MVLGYCLGFLGHACQGNAPLKRSYCQLLGTQAPGLSLELRSTLDVGGSRPCGVGTRLENSVDIRVPRFSPNEPSTCPQLMRTCGSVPRALRDFARRAPSKQDSSDFGDEEPIVSVAWHGSPFGRSTLGLVGLGWYDPLRV